MMLLVFIFPVFALGLLFQEAIAHALLLQKHVHFHRQSGMVAALIANAGGRPVPELAPAPLPAKTNWPAIAVLFAAGLAGAMQFAKAAPVLQLLQDELGFSLVTAGLSVSVLGMVGIVFAITIGSIAGSIGLVRGLLVALFGGALIAALGAMAPNGPLFMISRICEGFSHLLIVICAPALMAAHALPRDRPLALGLWGCFFGLGFAIISVVAPFIVPHVGWRGLMLAHSALLFVLGIVAMQVFRRSPYRDSTSQFPTLAAIARTHADVFRSGAPLLLSLTFCAYTFLFLMMMTFLGQFLLQVKAWPQDKVGTFIAMVNMVSLVATFLAGVLVRKGLGFFTGIATAFGTLAVATFCIFILEPDGWPLVVLAILMMVCFGALPGVVFANVPRIALTPRLAAITYAAIALFGNVGTFSGTPLFAIAYQFAGWPGGTAFVAAVCLLGILLAASVRPHLTVTASVAA